jgi:single-stranded DNA-binding protein
MSSKAVMVVSGYVVEDAEVRDNKIVKFRIGINRGYKEKGSDEWKEKAMWLRCTDFLVQRASKLAKGALVQVTGEVNWDERPEGGYFAPELKVMDVTVLKWANNDQDKSTTGQAAKREAGNRRKSDALPF